MGIQIIYSRSKVETIQLNKSQHNDITATSLIIARKITIDRTKSKGKNRNEPVIVNKQSNSTQQVESTRKSFSESNLPSNTTITTSIRERFHISTKTIGKGRFGTVRKCMDRKRCQWYAIKTITKTKYRVKDYSNYELPILQDLQHPNIIQFETAYEDSKYQHILTNLCTGGELYDRIIRKHETSLQHFSEHDTAKIIFSILDAISYCHDYKGIAHLDLKPENIMFLTPNDDAPIQIIDFGLARYYPTSGYMTKIVGSTRYTAPEVLNRKYTHICDVWSIGIICYILLCGYFPFDGDDTHQVYRKIKSGRFTFPSAEWDNISDGAKEFITSLLTYNFYQRPTAQEAMKHCWIQQELQLEPELNRKERKQPSKKINDVSTPNKDTNVFQVLCGTSMWWNPHVSVIG